MYMRHSITQFLVMFSPLLSLVHLTVLHIIDLILLCTVLTSVLRDTPHHIFAFIPMSITQCVDIYVVCGHCLSIGDG